MNRYKVQVKAPPTEGQANLAVIQIMAKYLGIAKSKIVVIRGLKSKVKTLHVLSCLLMGFVFHSSVLAAEIKLKNGEILVGTILEESQDGVFFEGGKGISNISKANIMSIDGKEMESSHKKIEVSSASSSKSEKKKQKRKALIINISSSDVSRAYATIPHQQTTFRPNESNLDPEVSAFLHEFFTLVDKAVVARVECMRWFVLGRSAGYSFQKYTSTADRIRNSLMHLEVPKELKKVRKLVYDGIRDQIAYFSAWNYEGDDKFEHKMFKDGWQQNQNISSSHTKLIQAYNSLMEIYPNETEHNKKAFFDHLCALDFV